MASPFSRLDECYSGKKVLVTGHTGFKGSWLSLWLKSMGAEVVGLSVDIPTNPSHFDIIHLADDLRDHRVDVSDFSAVQEIMKSENPDFVFHLAAQPLVGQSYLDPHKTFTTNTLGTINILEAVRTTQSHCVMVMITSDKCYDNVEWDWGYREHDRLGGGDPYSASKGAAELAISGYYRSYFANSGNIRVGIARAGNVIGGGDWAKDRIIPDSVKSWANGETLAIRNPSATRPWQHVLEPVGGYLVLGQSLMADSVLSGEPFNFGPSADQEHTVEQVIKRLARHFPKAHWEIVTIDDAHREAGLLKLNCDKALRHLGWKSVWDFQETIDMTADWYREFYMAKSENMREFSNSQIEKYKKDALLQDSSE